MLPVPTPDGAFGKREALPVIVGVNLPRWTVLTWSVLNIAEIGRCADEVHFPCVANSGGRSHPRHGDGNHNLNRTNYGCQNQSF